MTLRKKERNKERSSVVVVVVLCGRRSTPTPILFVRRVTSPSDRYIYTIPKDTLAHIQTHISFFQTTTRKKRSCVCLCVCFHKVKVHIDQKKANNIFSKGSEVEIEKGGESRNQTKKETNYTEFVPNKAKTRISY